MQKEIRLKYRWIKQRRKDVLEFLHENYWIDKNSSSKTTIEDDLGITGDDADEMIQKFENRFHVDMSKLIFTEYFFCEGEHSNMLPFILLLKLILLPFAILILPFSFPSFKEMLLYSPFSEAYAGKKSLTVGDLITSSFTHKFTLQKEVLIKLV